MSEEAQNWKHKAVSILVYSINLEDNLYHIETTNNDVNNENGAHDVGMMKSLNLKLHHMQT